MMTCWLIRACASVTKILAAICISAGGLAADPKDTRGDTGKVPYNPDSWAELLSQGEDGNAKLFSVLRALPTERELLETLLYHSVWWSGTWVAEGKTYRVLTLQRVFDRQPCVLVLTVADHRPIDWLRMPYRLAKHELKQEGDTAMLYVRFEMRGGLPCDGVQRYQFSTRGIRKYGSYYMQFSRQPPESQEEKEFFKRLHESGLGALEKSLEIGPPESDLNVDEIKSDVPLIDRISLGPKRLTWSQTVGSGDAPKHILIFDSGFDGWPREQTIVIVVTDATYKVLSWRDAGGSYRFRGADLIQDTGETRLRIHFQELKSSGSARNRIVDTDLVLKNDAPYNAQNPELDPPHVVQAEQGSPSPK